MEIEQEEAVDVPTEFKHSFSRTVCVIKRELPPPHFALSLLLSFLSDSSEKIRILICAIFHNIYLTSLVMSCNNNCCIG